MQTCLNPSSRTPRSQQQQYCYHQVPRCLLCTRLGYNPITTFRMLFTENIFFFSSSSRTLGGVHAHQLRPSRNNMPVLDLRVQYEISLANSSGLYRDWMRLWCVCMCTCMHVRMCMCAHLSYTCHTRTNLPVNELFLW